MITRILVGTHDAELIVLQVAPVLDARSVFDPNVGVTPVLAVILPLASGRSAGPARSDGRPMS